MNSEGDYFKIYPDVADLKSFFTQVKSLYELYGHKYTNSAALALCKNISPSIELVATPVTGTNRVKVKVYNSFLCVENLYFQFEFLIDDTIRKGYSDDASDDIDYIKKMALANVATLDWTGALNELISKNPALLCD